MNKKYYLFFLTGLLLLIFPVLSVTWWFQACADARGFSERLAMYNSHYPGWLQHTTVSTLADMLCAALAGWMFRLSRKGNGLRWISGILFVVCVLAFLWFSFSLM
jgi:hypothetical protein